MNKPKVSPQAAAKTVLRYAGVVSTYEVAEAIGRGEHSGHLRLTKSRSLCSIVTARGPVYFVWHKRRRVVITMIAREKARALLLAEGRMWPPRRGKRVDTFNVQLVSGPDKGPWRFTVLRTDGDECYSFTVDNDVGLSGDYILELAWENNPHPADCRDITLDDELRKLFAQEGENA